MEMAGIVCFTGANIITQARELIEQIGRVSLLHEFFYFYFGIKEKFIYTLHFFLNV